MAKQLHKNFSDEQIKELFERYDNGEIKRKHIQKILGIGKSRFFVLLHAYRNDPIRFSVKYIRKAKTRTIPQCIEQSIMKELKIDQKAIQNKDIPLRKYNYSYVKDRLADRYNQKVSLSTVIRRAKQHGFHIPKKLGKAIHDREVLTNYVGELIQHDTSHHLWAPDAGKKWYLITSLDDYSRYMLYARLLEKETSWAHINGLQTVVLKHGVPHQYYVDSHSIFRFVQGRDSIWRNHKKTTDQVITQWKKVAHDCGIDIIYALSAQAKGKAERPYGWLQDRLIRTCIRENVTNVHEGQKILDRELDRYNHHQVHSTTLEIPYSRFQRAIYEKQSLFRAFAIKKPYQSVKDIFCLRLERIVDKYRKISLNNLQFKLDKAIPKAKVDIRIYLLPNDIAELRFWFNNALINIQKVKQSDLKGVHF